MCQGQVWIGPKHSYATSLCGYGDQQLVLQPCSTTDLALCSPGTRYKMITSLCGFLGRCKKEFRRVKVALINFLVCIHNFGIL